MRRMAVIGVMATAVLTLGIGIAVAVFVGSIEVRSFSIDRIAVDAEVLPDGSMLVTEEVTYTFSGADDQPFSVGTRSFEGGRHPGTVTEIAAYEGDRQLDTLLSTPWLYEWDIYPSPSGTRTFRLEYKVVNAVQVWADTAELYWNWVGRTSPAIGEWSATVSWPAGAGDLRTWAHGPLDGVVHIDGDEVIAAVDDVPAGQFVDTRTVGPTERFNVAPNATPHLEQILRQEARNAEEANRARANADRIENLRQLAARIFTVLMAPLILLAGLVFYLVWNKWGRDPTRPADIGDYWREVPNDPPAVGAALLKWRTVDSDAFSATVLDLARRGYLRIERYVVDRKLLPDRTDHRFIATSPKVADDLLPFEQRVLRWLFGSGKTSVTQDELVEKSKADPTAANKFWTSFKSDVQAELDRREYLVKGKGLAFAIHFLVVTLLAIISIVAIAVGALVAGLIGLAASLVLLPLGILHRSRTPAGTRRDSEWRALRRYLQDFSNLEEAPVGHLALWDHYLVAATALGVARELLEALETKFPEVLESNSVAPWYVMNASSSVRMRGIGNFGSTFGSTAVSAFSPPSSSGGGGGGFSSGGGGGGGGGGFGAR